MKTKSFLVIVVSVVVVFAGVLAAAAQGPQPLAPQLAASSLGTGFTYQGQLKRSGAPINAVCDFIFASYDAANAGAQVGGNVPATLSVTNGLFTTLLDFGSGVFEGSARWLDIQVRCPSGGGGYTPLLPREPLSPAPYALALPGLWTQQNATAPNLIGGYSGNIMSPTVVGGTIGGGGSSAAPNRVYASNGTVGGGLGNTASGYGSTIGGGGFTGGNHATNDNATVGGGANNNATGISAVIAGGYQNSASASDTAVSGGYSNTAAGPGSSVGGGDFNLALAPWSRINGGYSNTVTADHATVGGGSYNKALATSALIAGGFQNSALQPDSAVGGGFNNLAGAPRATIGGGTGNVISLTAENGTIGGGAGNLAAGFGSIIAGGENNVVSNTHATVGGGVTNHAFGDASTIAGGFVNTASGFAATINGGYNNTASGDFAAVPGGTGNLAAGNYSLAGGLNAHAQHPGAFVWAESSGAVLSSTANDQFVVRASGGAFFFSDAAASMGVGLAPGSGSWSTLSDRSAKMHFNDVDSRAILAQLVSLPIQTWNYKAQDASIRHMGPMAQDFHAAFGLGENATTISTVDAQGVALTAIQGLYEIVTEQGARIAQLEAARSDHPQLAAPDAGRGASTTATDNPVLAAQVAQVQARNAALEQQNAALAARVTALEQARSSENSIPSNWLLFAAIIVVGVVALRGRLR